MAAISQRRWTSSRQAGAGSSRRASPAWLAEHGAPASVEALRGLPLWVWEGALVPTDGGTAVRLRDGGLLPVQPAVVCNDVHQLHVVVRRGLCLAVLPTSPFDGLEPDEVSVLEGALGGGTGLWLAVPDRSFDLPWVRRLVEDLRQVFALFEDAGAAQAGG